MSSIDEVSSLSQLTGTASIGKRNAKSMMLASKTCKCDHLGGENIVSIKIETSSDRKKYQGFDLAHQMVTIKTTLENLRMKSRMTPDCNGLYAHLVSNDGSSIIDDYVSASEGLTMLSLLSATRASFVSTACSVPVPSINDDENAIYIMMTAQ